MANGRIAWIGPDDPPASFPPVSDALKAPNGLLAAGGDLSPERLVWAYRNGIFPWYDAGQPLLWWSPDPRCVFLPGDFHASKRLRRAVTNSRAEIRVNTAFADVVRGCAGPRRHEQGTWITPDMMAAYQQLHAAGWAHSIEVWRDQRLCGGLYGLAIGNAFFGESMYTDNEDASKLALWFLDSMIEAGQFSLVDCQVSSRHLQTLGARSLPREKFMALLLDACTGQSQFQNWPDAPVSAARLAERP